MFLLTSGSGEATTRRDSWGWRRAESSAAATGHLPRLPTKVSKSRMGLEMRGTSQIPAVITVKEWTA